MTDGTTDQGSVSATVEPAELEELVAETTTNAAPGMIPGLGRVMDVNVCLSARVGQVRKTISEIVDLSPGSVIDLERGASEPIDLVIGEKLIARGEIVVVDDRYGVRIVEVLQDSD